METIVGVGPGMVVHDQDIRNGESRLAAELGLKPWLAAGFIVPLRVFDTQIRYLDGAGQPVDIENPFIHHNNRTIVGVGDPLVLARAAKNVGGFTLGGRFGLTIPLGRTEEDPFALGDMGTAHEHSQFGTGIFQPVFGFDVSRMFGKVRLETYALTIQALYENKHGYQAGDRYAAGIAGAMNLGKKFRVRATFEVQHETAEKWGGIVHTDEGNIGRTDLLAGVEATWRIDDKWYLSGSLKLPVYTHVQGGQLNATAFVGLSIGTQFHLWEGADDHDHAHGKDDHDHDHGKGDKHAHDDHAKPVDWTGLDKQDATNDGSAVPLVPVIGKITVFDFWASWCAPCKVVERELAELARRHPNDLAVRKLDVIDDDSAASKKYVGKFTLPHIKVYGRDGKLLWERSAAPLELVGAVAKLLAAKPAPVAVAGARRIPITANDKGYVPNRIEVQRGERFVLVFTRATANTCATDVHFALPDGTRIDKDLPLGTAVEIPLAFDKPGEVTFACGMDMDRGTIVVK